MTFELTLDEAQVIVNALATQPYHIVAGLIDKLKAQAAEQMKPKVPVTEVTSTTPVEATSGQDA